MVSLIKRSLTGKLIVLVLGVSLVPIAIVGYLSYSSGKATIKSQFLDSLTTIVKSRETAIAFYLKSKTGRISDFGSDGFICDTLEKINQGAPDAVKLAEELNRHLMENKKSLDPEIYGTHILDLTGKVVASSEKEVIGNDKSNDVYFLEGKKGMYVKDIYRYSSEGKDLIAFSTPLISRVTKKVIGVIVNRYDLTGLNKITTDREGMGETGEVYVVNKGRYMVTESRFIKESILKQKVDTVPVRLFQEHGKDMAGIYPDYRGIPIVGASAGGILEKEFGLGWTVLAEIDVAEAFAPVKVLAFRIIWIGIFVALVVAVIAYFASKEIVKPIRRISEQVVKIGAGDLTVQVPYDTRKDEIGSLSKTLGSVVKNLREITKGVIDGVNVLSSSVSEILTVTTQVVASTAEMATSVSETTATVEEVKQTTQVSVQKAKYVSESAQKTVQISQNGKKSVDELINGMSRIKERMVSIIESIQRLNEQREIISEIIETVDGLAEQTNLLSVNAAIEAAKAGEEGKGFTVVAQEIRYLAEQSKQATAQIRSILNNVQKSTSAAVMATEQGNRVVDEGVRQSTQAGESIKMLTDGITESAQAAAQIVASSQQQVTGMDQVALAMDNIKLASSQNVAGTKQTETAIQSLNELGQKLKHMVERYKV